jgi:hypothetical protein
VTLPGTQVTILDAPPPRPAANDVGTLFAIGLTDRGALTPTLVSSLDDYVAKFGPRVSYSLLYDALEAFFAEGGGRAYISRVVGPTSVVATLNLQDSVPANTLAVDAANPGAWANGAAGGLSVDVDVPSSGLFVLKVYLNGALVETSPSFADKVDAVQWSASSAYVRVRDLGGANDPVALGSAANLAGGTDDRANITDTEWQAATDRVTADLGPGQVTQPGRTTTAAYTQLANHAAARNRFALLDGADTATAATLVTAAAAVRALGREKARRCQLLAPWVTAPGLTAGTTRAIPPSTLQAGMAARSDAAGGNPNRAVAGRNGISRFALDVRATWTDTDRESLADAGVTVIRNLQGQITTYDDVTLVDPTTDPEWLGAAGNRLVMQIVAAGTAIAEAHMFAQESGTVEFSAFEGDLVAMLTRYWMAGALYPSDDVTQAFRVEAGPTVNTPQTIAQRRLIAAIALKISPNARRVEIQITNTPLEQAL